MTDRMTKSIFIKLSRREFPIGHPHYGEKTGRDGISFMGSIRDGTLDILSYIPEGDRFDLARSYFDRFLALEKQYEEHKAEGGDCTKGSPGQDIRTRSQRVISELIDSVLSAL